MNERVYKPCDQCGKTTTYSGTDEHEPHDGYRCEGCGEWVCGDCVNWDVSGEYGILCNKCTKE